MPKGGDLHVHLSGAIYAESFIDWASENALCVDRSTSKLISAACDSCEPYKNKPSVRCAYQDHVLYDQLIDAWSMRNWHPEDESGHDHFFATFEKFGPAMEGHVGDALAEVASRGAEDQLQYIEVMHTADGRQAATLGEKIEWDNDFGNAPRKDAGRWNGGHCRCGSTASWTPMRREKKKCSIAERRRRLRDAG